VIDAMGKPESGFAEGNLKWLGDYQECVGIKAVTDGKELFTGKYCKIDLPLTGILPAAAVNYFIIYLAKNQYFKSCGCH
jgi:hypothetical protein